MVRRDENEIKILNRCPVPRDGLPSGKLRLITGWLDDRHVRNRLFPRLVLLIISLRRNSATRARHRHSLIGQAENQNPGTLDSFVMRVQCVCDRVHNVLGHMRIDLAGQLDETYV